MSLNLLSTAPGGSSRFSKRYMNDDVSSSTDRACFATEYDRMVYMCNERTSTSPHQVHFHSFNIQTSEIKYLGYITKAQMNNYTDKRIQSFMCDGEYFYITMYSGVSGIFVVNMNDLTEVTYYPSTAGRGFTCYTRGWWYDLTKIIMMDNRGMAYFDTKTHEWSYESYESSNVTGYNCLTFCDKGVAKINTNMRWYNRETGTVTQFNFPTSSYNSECCYGEGKIWVVNQAYVFSFDVETETWDSSYTPVPFGNRPKCVVYTEGLLYCIFQNTNKLWVFETQRKKFAYLILPWTIINEDDAMVSMAVYHKYVFLQMYTFGIMNYEGLYKYNIGYKIIQYSLPFSEELCEYHTKDPCLYLQPNYLTFKNTDDEIELTPIEDTHLKACHVNKKDYKEIYEILFK